MLQKNAALLTSLFISSLCLATDGLPDSNNWFIQQLAAGYLYYSEDIQVSDTYVIFQSDGTQYYDGVGIYELQHEGSKCYEPSLSGNSIVSKTFGGEGGILLYHLGDRHLYEVSEAYYGYPDVYENEVVWEAGPDSQNTNVYLDYGFGPTCLTLNAQCNYNGKRPRISADTIAWISNDGNDDEIFILKDSVITQLTNNDIDDGNIYDEKIYMADNGTIAWTAFPPNTLPHSYYYDGQHVHQLTVGDTTDMLWGISEMGVLYSVENHPNYPEYAVVLMLHTGVEEVFIFGTEAPMPDGLWGASIGGNSIAWIGRQTWIDDWSVYMLKGQELLSWPLPSIWQGAVGVWGNQLVWTPETESLYFGEYQGSPACVDRPKMDGNNDCKVNLIDFAIFASEWLDCGYEDQSACYN